MHTATLSLDQLEPLFDALKEGGVTPLPDALEHTISIAKAQHMAAEDLIQCLNDYGIQTSDAINTWVIKKYRD